MSAMRAIDPAIAAVLAAAPVSSGELSLDTLHQARGLRAQMLEAVQLSDAVGRSDHVVPGPEGSPDVVVRVHRPKAVAGSLPCVYAIHGGGYIMGSRQMEDLRFDSLCPDLGIVGVSVEYRLAPETSYPGPLEDCYAGLKWVFDHAAAIGIDPDRIGISGASAGGGLAAGLSLLVRDRGEFSPAFQLLIYPMLDDREITPSSHWQVPIWSPENNRFGWHCYLGDLYGQDDIPAYGAPARAENLQGLPPASVWVGTSDIFCDENILYAQRLIQAGIPTELHVYPDAPHGFDGVAPNSVLARRCKREIRNWLATAIGQTLEVDSAV